MRCSHSSLWGDIVIAAGAVRDEGTTRHYAPAAYPAVSTTAVMSALQAAAERRAVTAHTGIVHTTDTY